jgi:hypothetical protein
MEYRNYLEKLKEEVLVYGIKDKIPPFLSIIDWKLGSIISKNITKKTLFSTNNKFKTKKIVLFEIKENPENQIFEIINDLNIKNIIKNLTKSEIKWKELVQEELTDETLITFYKITT